MKLWIIAFLGIGMLSPAWASQMDYAGTSGIFGRRMVTHTVSVGCQFGHVQTIKIRPRKVGFQSGGVSDRLALNKLTVHYADGKSQSFKSGPWMKPVDGYYQAKFQTSKKACVTQVSILGRTSLRTSLKGRHLAPKKLVVDVFVK